MDFLKEDSEQLATVEDAEAAEEAEEITLLDYMRAGYALIHVRTEEDMRARSIILDAIDDMKKYDQKLLGWEWSATDFLCEATRSYFDRNEVSSNATSIPTALDHLVENDDPVVLVIYNARQFLQLPPVIQRLKDAAEFARMKGSHIILVGPNFEYPPELQNGITVWDLKLPTYEQFIERFDTITEMYKEELNSEITEEVVQNAAASAVGMTELQGENSVSLSMAKHGDIHPSLIQSEKEQIIKKSDVLEFVGVDEGMDKLGGFDVFKEWIAKRRRAYSKEARDFGLRPPKGILLVGEPGTGKSLCAKVLANYLRIPLIRFDVGKVFRGLQGGSENAVRNALKTVEAVAPNVLWIDEIEKATAGVQSSGKTDGGTTARVMGTILSWMQDNTKPIFICATANNPSNLPAELLRKGRFSEIWGVTEPNSESRKEIWDIHLKKVRPDLEVNLDRLSEVSKGYVGAEIESIIEEALYDAFDAGEDLTQQYVEGALSKIIPQSKTSKDKLDVLRAWMRERVRYVETPDITEASGWGAKASQRKLKIKQNEEG
jgi:ATP-dependent 26S proteasome regulatory subunit